VTERLPQRTVVVHERFTEPGGSELVVAAMVGCLQVERVLAPVVDPAVVPEELSDLVEHSVLQRLYRHDSRYAHLLPLLPWAMRRFDVSGADLVIASHHAFANRVHVPDDVPFLSYTHTPPRWIWDEDTLALEGPDGLKGRALRAYAARQRAADRRAAARPWTIMVNSTAVADRVARWWGRSSVVVPPPVDTGRYRPDPSVRREPFLLWAGRLVPYKRPEVAVRAARLAGMRLVVAGEGRSRREVEAIAPPGTEFLGRVTDAELVSLLQTCTAVVFPGEEDFGIVPVEAMACGTPVVALDAGGARDTVVDGVTGVLVDAPDRSTEAMAERFAEALRTFDADAFDPAKLRRHAETFSTAEFGRRLHEVVRSTVRGEPLAARP
jgi:glycosyltransferase involved in cell wall biosynthesis